MCVVLLAIFKEDILHHSWQLLLSMFQFISSLYHDQQGDLVYIWIVIFIVMDLIGFCIYDRIAFKAVVMQ